MKLVYCLHSKRSLINSNTLLVHNITPLFHSFIYQYQKVDSITYIVLNFVTKFVQMTLYVCVSVQEYCQDVHIFSECNVFVMLAASGLFVYVCMPLFDISVTTINHLHYQIFFFSSVAFL